MRRMEYEFDLTEIKKTLVSPPPSEAKSAEALALATLAVAERLSMVVAALENIHNNLGQIAMKK